MHFGAPSVSSIDRINRKSYGKSIGSRLKIRWNGPFSSTPSLVIFEGEGGKIRVNDLQSFLDYLNGKLSKQGADAQRYVLDLSQVEMGMVVAELVEKGSLTEVVARRSWRLIGLITQEELGFKAFSSIKVISGPPMVLSFKAKNQFSEQQLERIQRNSERAFGKAFRVEQDGLGTVVLTEVDAAKRDEKISAKTFVERALKDAGSRNRIFYSMSDGKVQFAKGSPPPAIRIAFPSSRTPHFGEEEWQGFSKDLTAHMGDRFGGSWRLEDKLLQDGSIVLVRG